MNVCGLRTDGQMAIIAAREAVLLLFIYMFRFWRRRDREIGGGGGGGIENARPVRHAQQTDENIMMVFIYKTRVRVRVQ